MLKPVRYDLYEKALNKPKTKIDKRMITVEDALLFAEWLHERYHKGARGWVEKQYKNAYPDSRVIDYTTRELWELYQQFLGKKTTK